MIKKHFKALVFGLLGLVIIARLSGWESIYRPLANEPVISLYTYVNFILLFFLQFFRYDLVEVKRRTLFTQYIRLIVIFILGALLLFYLSQHFIYDEKLFLGTPLPSAETLVTQGSFLVYESFRASTKNMTIFADIALLSSSIWIYLSIVAYAFRQIFLTGALGKIDISLGFAIPTIVFCVIYLAVAFSNDKLMVSKNLYKYIRWGRTIILFSIGMLAVCSIIFICILEFYFPPMPGNEFGLQVIIMLYIYTLCIFYITFVQQLSKTHFKIQSICSYTHKIKNAEGEWVDLEKFYRTAMV